MPQIICSRTGYILIAIIFSGWINVTEGTHVIRHYLYLLNCHCGKHLIKICILHIEWQLNCMLISIDRFMKNLHCIATF